MSNKRKFDWNVFSNGYGTLFDAQIYSKEDSLAIVMEEFDYTKDSLVAEVDYVRWVANVGLEERFHLDMPEDGVHGTYLTCNKEDKNAFKCWRVLKCNDDEK